MHNLRVCKQIWPSVYTIMKRHTRGSPGSWLLSPAETWRSQLQNVTGVCDLTDSTE